MSERVLNGLNTIARGVLLLLLAGLLIGRREFAHLNLGDVWLSKWIHAIPPTFASYLYISETMLLALSPLALLEVRNRWRTARVPGAVAWPWREQFQRAFGWELLLPIALIGWGALHAGAAKISGGDTYLIFRQSALAMYPIIFIYAFLFFGDSERHIRLAIGGAIAAAILCALVDSVGLLDPKLDANGQPPYGEWMPIYGQETLPIAILGLIYFTVSTRSWGWRDLALMGVCLTGWRQGVRPMQSVVPIGMGGTLMLLLVCGITLACLKQRATLKRAAIVLAIFGVLGVGYRVMRSASSKPEQPGTETVSEIKAWNLGAYSSLFDIYNRAGLPDIPTRMLAWRPPYERVDDPEVYKLQSVFLSTPSVSIRNNMWRFLVWQRMLKDWREGHSVLGAGVGKPWFYRALYSTGFHYGDDREGLDPHNSYINTLYRYGAIGLALLLSIIGATWRRAFLALRRPGGDPLLEALLLYSGYTVIFAFFTVSLEGPAYSMPFWMSLGLVYARARALTTNGLSQ